MAKDKLPATQAIRLLKQNKIIFSPRPYKYEENGGTKVSARELNVTEHQIIKTLVMADSDNNALIVLMHGDREVSLKQLARQLNVKQINPCQPQTADRLTGYQTGGISPFGTKQPLPVYMEESISLLESICINGGRRGLLVELKTQDLIDILQPAMVQVGIP